MVPMPKSRPPSQVLDFTVLPLHRPALPSYPLKRTHYLYIRSNAPRIPTEDTPREIFVKNVPIDATETHFKALFADNLGGARIENVDFEDARVAKGIRAPAAQGKKRKRGADDEDAKPEEVGQLPKTWDREVHRSGSTAVIRCVDRPSAEMALREARKAVKTGREIVWGEGVEGKVPLLGKERYAAHHKLRYPDQAVLQSSVDRFMEAFSAQEEEKARLLASQRAEPDEDGFITVTRGGRTGPAREEETKGKEEEFKKREKNRVKDDFYRFQVREKKKEKAKDLVRGFEEDRRKVEEMRRRRGKVRPE
ncbi:uncharacterized protein LTR77_004141 [Saxophila tyrrhenica]|uniref:Ribosomal RNA-processing protein 7 n=1 Tax=Saxophila tyrrhenica TaxID=1690608 RepID=A0AAV9PF92_9PEZI|nr:hypothetical protein LTR77_004141 [Saxophila tyrrhenica]